MIPISVIWPTVVLRVSRFCSNVFVAVPTSFVTTLFVDFSHSRLIKTIISAPEVLNVIVYGDEKIPLTYWFVKEFPTVFSAAKLPRTPNHTQTSVSPVCKCRSATLSSLARFLLAVCKRGPFKCWTRPRYDRGTNNLKTRVRSALASKIYKVVV